MRYSALLCVLLCPASLMAAERRCISPEEALDHINKDSCVAAHVYNVVELPDGTRFLDVCATGTRDEDCRFSIVSRAEDRDDVGDLNSLRDQDIRIRGTIRPFGGRAEVVLSHSRQLHGGAEKFHPNPALLSGFSAEHERPAFNDKTRTSSESKGSFSTKKRQ